MHLNVEGQMVTLVQLANLFGTPNAEKGAHARMRGTTGNQKSG